MLEAVYEKWNGENPKNRIEKKDRFKYDIDHNIPFSEGSKTKLSNFTPKLREDRIIEEKKIE